MLCGLILPNFDHVSKLPGNILKYINFWPLLSEFSINKVRVRPQ